MSVQPFSGLKQADDFMNVYLHTSNSYNASKRSPRWNMPSSGAICDRYKLYKRVVAVVNFIDLPPDPLTPSGNGILIRDVSNQQMNSIDSLTNQSNVIYYLQGVDADDAGMVGNSKSNFQKVGHPYEKVNPFGEQSFTITTTNSTTPLAITVGWGIHITYYFYY